MTVGTVCTREVVTAGRESPVGELAQLMRSRHVGDVVIVESRDGRRYPVGMVTDRDLVLEVMAEGLDAGAVVAGDLLTEPLVVVEESEELDQALARMRAHGVRRLPVVDVGGVLVGLLSSDDVIEMLSDQVGDLALLVTREQRHEQQRRP